MMLLAGSLCACSQGVDGGGVGLTFGPPPGQPPVDDDDDDGGTDAGTSDSPADTDVMTGQADSMPEMDTTAGADDSATDDSDTDDPPPDPPMPGECMAGQTQSCYTGPAGTQNVGICMAGTQTCGADEPWGACLGESGPGIETCDGLDNDCNGAVDEGCLCDPMNPAAVCGAGQHCFPSPTGDTVCQGPTGLGGQYAACASDADCGPEYVCVDTGQGTVYCMAWCTSILDCPALLDSCIPLDPAVYAGGQEYGVCYDGLP